MRKLEQLTKKELIDYICEIRPKADAYDKVCEQLGITDNILVYINDINTKNKDAILDYLYKIKHEKK